MSKPASQHAGVIYYKSQIAPPTFRFDSDSFLLHGRRARQAGIYMSVINPLKPTANRKSLCLSTALCLWRRRGKPALRKHVGLTS